MNTEEFDKAVDRLQRPFAVRDIDWVPNYTYGDDTYNDKVIAVAPYIRREAVITRFNVVCGPGQWENLVEPLGNFGLYQGIALNHNGEWVRKWDGAQIDDGNGGRIDAVKAVISRSIRRVGEVWGVGLYLQFIPQLFAVKRPSDYYSSDETWEDRKKNLKIRWDHPPLPKEYLPEFMTPEQYIRMKRILKYFSDEKKLSARELISSWEDDFESVSYENAELTIGMVEDRILKRLKSIDNRQVTVPNKTTRPNDKSSTTSNDGQNKKSHGQSQQPENATKEPQATQPAPEGKITGQQLKELLVLVKKVEKLDPDHVWLPSKELQPIKDAGNKHHKGQELIDEKDFKDWKIKLQSAVDAIDDELPF